MAKTHFIYGQMPGAEIFDGTVRRGEGGRAVVTGGSRDYDAIEVMQVPRAHLDEGRDLIRQIEFVQRSPASSSIGQDAMMARILQRDALAVDATQRLLAFKKARCKPVEL